MVVYRICLEKWSKELKASGAGGRWNSKGKLVIYTAASRALACLENLVHRSGEGLNSNFKILTIEIPDSAKITEIKISELDKDWYEYVNYSYCRSIGDKWIQNCNTLIMKVPSAIIPAESNYLINPSHNDFKKIRIAAIEDFKFDPRVQ
jgi:RES domain-containing protein